MKQIIAVLCALTMLFPLVSCSGKETETDYSNQTLTGKVTSIDGTKVTLQLGEISTQDGMQQSGENEDRNEQTPPNMPDINDGTGGDTPPEKPDGEGQPDAQNPPDTPDTNDGTGGDTPPDMPDGEGQPDAQNPSDTPDTNDGAGGDTPSDMPDGDMPSDVPSDGMTPPGGNMTMYSFTAGEETVTLDFEGAAIKVESSSTETTDGSLDNITVDTVLVVETGDQNTVNTVTIKFTDNAEMQEGSFGGSGEVTQGTSANTLDTDGTYADLTYTSTGDDENALRVDGANVTLTGVTVEKSAGNSSNTEDGDFYGMNAALLATNGATVTIQDSTITSSAQNGNGVFSYGSNTTVNISDSKITTSADNSGGIQTTGGGTTNASNLTVETSGSSAAAIRSDRGGGTVNVDSGSYTTNGYNSPAVYSTANITVKNATLTANNSEALVIEGQNSITLENCIVSGNMSDTMGSSSDENVHNVMIYQSMSGDADVGTSTFSMSGGTLISNNGDMFYVTNTHCILTLSDVTLVQNDSQGYFLRVTGNSASRGWGAAGENGGQVDFTVSNQTISGDIAVDTISTLNMTLTEGSNYTGAINIIDNAQNGASVSDNIALTIDSDSIWTLTGNCTLTSLNNNGTINFNGYTITLADGTILG